VAVQPVTTEHEEERMQQIDDGIKRVIGAVILATATLPLLPQAFAAEAAYPTRPVRMIVPQSASGSTDLIARVVALRLSESLGQQFVVDNRPGAGSINGTEMVARATPDGHTLLTVAASFTINPSLHARLPFDPVRDFAPITRLATLPHILVVHPTVQAKTVKDLIALAKAKPGELNFSSSGIATSTHLAAELFMHLAGVKMVNVPFKGGGPGMVGLLSGQTHLYFATISTALPHIKAGKLRALAVSSPKRSTAAPEYPTIAEAGVPGYAHASWVGTLAPAKTPPAVIAKLNSELNRITSTPEVKALLLRDGLEAVDDTPQEFAAIIREEVAKWMKVAKAAGIKAQ